MFEQLTLLSKPIFDNVFQTKTQKQKEITEMAGGTVIEKTMNELSMMKDLQWMTVLKQNRDEIGTTIKKDAGAVIGIEKVSFTEVISVLSQNKNTSWYDPFYTMSEYLTLLSTNVESAYDSDARLIKDLSETEYFSHSELEKVYSELRESKEQSDIVYPSEKHSGTSNMFTSLFSRFCFTRGLMIENMLDPFVWKDTAVENPEYIILHLVDYDGNHSPVVGKVSTVQTEVVELSTIIPTLDPDRRSIPVDQKSFEVEIISYDSEITDMYSNLSLDSPNSKSVLTPELEDMTEFKLENPLPL